MSVNIFNSLPDYLTDLVHDKKAVYRKINDILSHNPSYTVDEFLLFCHDFFFFFYFLITNVALKNLSGNTTIIMQND
jgi:hypothetical protein